MTPDLRYARLWQTLGWLLLALIVILSLMPHPPSPPLLAWDKLQHVLAYTTLMVWFRLAFAPRWRWPLLLLALSVALEFLQGWGGVRHFDLRDMLANAIGIAGGLVLVIATPLGGLLIRLERMLPTARREA